MLRTFVALLLVAVLTGCGGGGSSSTSTSSGSSSSGSSSSGSTSGSSSSGSSSSGSSTTTASNVAAIVIDSGPSSLTSQGVTGISNTPYVTVTVCVPGSTTNCATVDHVIVDTGSQGLRLVAGALSQSFISALPAQTTSGSPVMECLEFVNSYVWGPVVAADFSISGETAKAMPLQIIGAAGSPSVPSACSNGFTATNTVATFGGNGIIGIGTFPNDCGSFCAQSTSYQTGYLNSLPGATYWICPSSGCTLVSQAQAGSAGNQQLPNPISSFATDNNGSLIQLAAVTGTGKASSTGSLIFGIGTQTNNGLGSAKVYGLNANYGTFSTVYNGSTFPYSYVDSGTSVLSFDNLSITLCKDATWSGFYCPSSTLSLSATNTGTNGSTGAVSFNVGNADAMNVNYAALPTLAAPYSSNGTIGQSFAWGLPFFYGRTVYNAIAGASTPGGTGPYVAY